MLCQYCANLDLDQIMSKNGYRHHLSREDLQLSANSGCEGCVTICSLIDGTKKREHEDIPENISELPQTQIICTALAGSGYAETVWGLKFWQPNLLEKSQGLMKPVLCFAEPEDELSEIATSRPIAEISNSEKAFATAARWLQHCVGNHPLCCPTSTLAPTRLVFVGSSTTEPYIAHSMENQVQWATLSHCWGSSRQGITTVANIEDRKRKLELADLPILYTDAIKIVRKLGLQYVWIDFLCIIQDSNSDWSSESSKMDAYYNGAYLNISPPTMGIFSTANQHRAEYRSLVTLPCSSQRKHLSGFLHLRHPRYVPLENYLSRRAWVLQETILSNRILRYDADQLRWRCNSSIMAENQQSDISKIYNPPEKAIFEIPAIQSSSTTTTNKAESYAQIIHMNLPKALEWWYSTLHDYTNREITYPDDRFPGIAGLAKEFSRRTGYHYVCGVWREDLIQGLCWTCLGTKKQATLTSVLPSWSWASTNGLETGELLGRWLVQRSPISGDNAEILDIAVENEGADIYGRVKSASLTLRGRWNYMSHKNLLKSYFFNTSRDTRRKFDEILSEHDRGSHHMNLDQIICTMDAPVDLHKPHDLIMSQNAICFQLAKWRHRRRPLFGSMIHQYIYCLILEPVDESGELYQRIGMAEIPENLWETIQWNTKTVVII